jgi:hypothetical protein
MNIIKTTIALIVVTFSSVTITSVPQSLYWGEQENLSCSWNTYLHLTFPYTYCIGAIEIDYDKDHTPLISFKNPQRCKKIYQQCIKRLQKIGHVLVIYRCLS